MFEIGLGHYLTLGAIIFTIGIAGIFLNRKNIIVILMSIELILLASSLDLFTSNNIPLFSFIYSGIPPIFDPITGVPHAIASKPTSPSGSSLDGKINRSGMFVPCKVPNQRSKTRHPCCCLNNPA